MRTPVDTTENSELFLNLHPNKSIIEKPTTEIHTHSYVEIVYVYKGCLHQLINGQIITSKEGSITLLNPHIPHAVWVETSNDIVINIGIKIDTIQKTLLSISNGNETQVSQFMKMLLQRPIHPQRDYVFLPNAKHLEGLISDMFGEYYSRRFMYEKIIIADFINLLVSLLRRTQERTVKPDDPEDIIEYIEKHYAQLSMEQLCQHFNYSERQIRRILRTFTDDSLPGLLNQIKIHKACEYINRFQMPTEEILQNIGYDNANYFYRTFKTIVGVGISDYRQMTPGERPDARVLGHI